MNEKTFSLTSEPNILSWAAYVWYFDRLILSLAEVSVFLVRTRKVKRICNLISAEKATFQRDKCLAMLLKQRTMSSMRLSNSGCTWKVGRALR